MNKLLAIHLLMTASFAVNAAEQFETCMQRALSYKPGQVVKVEFKQKQALAIYEFDIRGIDGADWDIECDKSTGEIVETEREVINPNHPLFKSQTQISERDAVAIARKRYPGEVVEIEYEIEEDGHASYEFDIETPEGREIKVEVDATTGDIVESDIEIWQVGLE